MVVMIFPTFLNTAVQAESERAASKPAQVITAFNASDEDLKNRNTALGTNAERWNCRTECPSILKDQKKYRKRAWKCPSPGQPSPSII